MNRPICRCMSSSASQNVKLLQKIFRKKIRRYSSSFEKDRYADIVISGGGMVGTSLACALGSSGCFKDRTIVLLETGPKIKVENWNTAPFGNRVSAITPGSKKFFKDIGVWSKISQRRYNSFSDMYVWDDNNSILFDSYELLGMESMGYMVENPVIVESCLERVLELNNVDVKYETKISEIVKNSNNKSGNGYNEEMVEILLSNGEKLKTKLLIGADGFNSFVRSNAGLTTYDYDYGQMAVVATLEVETENFINQTAWQRYLLTGPVAILPMTDKLSSLVWSTKPDIAKRLMGLTEEEFVQELNEAYSSNHNSSSLLSTLNNLVKTSLSIVQPGSAATSLSVKPPVVTSCQPNSRGMFPLILKHSNHYVNSRIALVGDSAHRIHPMAGQGVNLGFGDVKCLVKNIEKNILNGKDYGSLENLFAYETERQRHVTAIITAINGLNTIFSSSAPPIAAARSFGLGLTNALSPLKKQIVSFAMS